MEPRAQLEYSLDQLMRCPRLYIPSVHYAVVVAYLDGLDRGLGVRPSNTTSANG